MKPVDVTVEAGFARHVRRVALRSRGYRRAKLRDETERLAGGAPDGERQDTITVALIELAVHATVTSLDASGMNRCVRRALEVGAGPAQVHETVVVVSGLGVHTLMEGSPAGQRRRPRAGG